MDALFDFIFGNLAFLIVIIGAIMSFLKRANQNQQQPPKNKKVKPFMPELEDFFGETTQPEENKKEVVMPMMPTFTGADKASRKNREEMIIEPMQYFEKLTESKKINAETDEILQPLQVSKAIQQQPLVNMKEINRKKVIEGIIWGEIVGAPRAKKKHSYTFLKRG